MLNILNTFFSVNANFSPWCFILLFCSTVCLMLFSILYMCSCRDSNVRKMVLFNLTICVCCLMIRSVLLFKNKKQSVKIKDI